MSTTPEKLSLSRMEEEVTQMELGLPGSDSGLSVRDSLALLSWAKRARASLLFVEENCVNANEHCEECEEIEKLLSECGE